MELTIGGLAYASGDRSRIPSMTVTLHRQMPGPDRPDYWLGELTEPIQWESEADGELAITHVVLGTQWENTRIAPGISRVPVGVAYVIDESLIHDDCLDIAKIRYVATGVADDTTAGRPATSPANPLSGVFGRLFGKRGE